MLLKLRYTLARDPHQHATVFGDPEAIRNLYWQLTHNYKAQDGQEIGTISVFNTDGIDVTDSVMTRPFASANVTTIQM